MSDKLFYGDQFPDFLISPDDFRFSPIKSPAIGFFSPYQQQQQRKFNQQVLFKSPPQFFSSPNQFVPLASIEETEQNNISLCFEENPLSLLFQDKFLQPIETKKNNEQIKIIGSSFQQPNIISVRRIPRKDGTGIKGFKVEQVRFQLNDGFQTPQSKIEHSGQNQQKKYMSERPILKQNSDSKYSSTFPLNQFTPTTTYTKNSTPYKYEYFENGESDLPARSEKGLRNLSVKVKEIVYDMKIATYKSVAEKLIQILQQTNKLNSKDEQNIKRRVYDALNVMIASGVLKKEGKKVISDEQALLRQRNENNFQKNEKSSQIEKLVQQLNRINCKKERLNEFVKKVLSIQNLIEKNQFNKQENQEFIPFPFLTFIQNQSNVKNNPYLLFKVQFKLGKKNLQIYSKHRLELKCDLDVLMQIDYYKRNFSTVKKYIPNELISYLSGDLRQWIYLTDEKEYHQNEDENQSLYASL